MGEWGMADRFRVAAVSYHGCDIGRSLGSRIAD